MTVVVIMYYFVLNILKVLAHVMVKLDLKLSTLNTHQKQIQFVTPTMLWICKIDS